MSHSMNLNVLHSGPAAASVAAENALAFAQLQIMMDFYKNLEEGIEANKSASQVLGKAASDSAVNQGNQSIAQGAGQIGGGVMTGLMPIAYDKFAGGSAIDQQIQGSQQQLDNLKSFEDELNRPGNQGIQIGAANPLHDAQGQQDWINDMRNEGFIRRPFQAVGANNRPSDTEYLEAIKNTPPGAALKAQMGDKRTMLNEEIKNLQGRRSSITSRGEVIGGMFSNFSQGTGNVISGQYGVANKDNENKKTFAQFVSDSFNTLMKAMMDMIQNADQRRQAANQTEAGIDQANYRV